MTYPFQSSYPFGLPDSLPFLFNGGEEGAIYDPSNLSSMYTTVAGTTAVAAYGDPVGRIRDVRATETFTATYTSDFSAGVDGWIATNGTAVGNIDAIDGQDNWLRLTVGAAGGVTILNKTGLFTRYKRYRVVLQVYVPSGQTYVDGFAVYSGNTSLQLLYSGEGENGTTSSVDVTEFITGTDDRLRVYALDGASTSINSLAVGEVYYVRAVVISETNLNDAVQATSGSRPLYARMPKTGIRNLLTATATLSTQNYTTTNVAHTLSFYGTGTVTLSGTSTDGPLVGTGANDRVTLTFTPTAGTLTLTVSGSVTSAQLEIGSSATAYQLVGANRYDISESGIEDVYYLNFDGTDDYMTIPGSASAFKFMHDGTGGFFAGGAGFRVPSDVGAQYTLYASRSSNAEIGARLIFDDASTNVANASALISNGSVGYLSIGVNNSALRTTPQVWRTSAAANLDLYTNGDLLDSEAIASPSAASATNDMGLGRLPNGTAYAPLNFFGCLFIDRVPTDAEANLIDRVYSGKTGASL